MMLKLFLFSSLLAGFISCQKSNSICLQSTTNPLRIGFYTYTQDSSHTKKQVSIKALTVILSTAAMKDTIYNKASVTSIQLPLSGHAPLSVFSLYLDSLQARPDSLFVYSQSQPQFISQACGYIFSYTIDSIKMRRFATDSILLINPSLSPSNTNEHAQIIL